MRTDKQSLKALRLGSEIKEAGSIDQLESIIESMQADCEAGELRAYDKDNLQHYVEHRIFVLNHKPDTVEKLSKRIGQLTAFNEVTDYIASLYGHLKAKRIKDSEFQVLHSAVCDRAGELGIRQFELQSVLKEVENEAAI